MKKTLAFLSIFIMLFFAFVKASLASSAFFSLTPSAYQYAVGDTVKLNLQVNTGATIINAVSVNLNYPGDLLEFSSIQDGPILSIVAQKSAYGGIVKMTGAIFPPGFSGNATLATILFKAKKAGTAQISFVLGSHILTQDTSSDILSLTQSTGTSLSIGSSSGSSFSSSSLIPTRPIIMNQNPNANPNPVSADSSMTRLEIILTILVIILLIILAILLIWRQKKK